MPSAARVGDMVKQDTPHCHAPIHPPAPTPTPVPHPGLPLTIVTGMFTVLIGNQPAAILGSMTTPCLLPGCVPGGPGNVVMGSATVIIGTMPAARVNDMTAHSSCVAPHTESGGKNHATGMPHSHDRGVTASETTPFPYTKAALPPLPAGLWPGIAPGHGVAAA